MKQLIFQMCHIFYGMGIGGYKQLVLSRANGDDSPPSQSPSKFSPD